MRPALVAAAKYNSSTAPLIASDGFGLARPSNTTPVIVLRFEADNEAALKRIQGDFRRVIREQAEGLELPFGRD